MKLFIASDHAGFQLKEALQQYLTEQGFEIEDMGAFNYDPADDYPDFVIPLAKRVAENPDGHRGIVLGKSGQGEAIAANKIKGIRAAVVWNLDIAKLSRQHNDANVLSLPAGFLSPDQAKAIVKAWIDTPFSRENRHLRRVNKIKATELNQTNK